MSQFLFVTCGEGHLRHLRELVGEIVPIGDHESLLTLSSGLVEPSEVARTWSVVGADSAFLGMLEELDRSHDVSQTSFGKVLAEVATTSDQLAAIYAGPSGSTKTVNDLAAFFDEIMRQLREPMNEVYVQYRRLGP